jgi:hypothetical protein
MGGEEAPKRRIKKGKFKKLLDIITFKEKKKSKQHENEMIVDLFDVDVNDEQRWKDMQKKRRDSFFRSNSM